MKKGGESETNFSSFASNLSPNFKGEKGRLNSLLMKQDAFSGMNTPYSQLIQLQNQANSQTQHSQSQSFSNPLENIMASANLGGVFLSFENPIVFGDSTFEDGQNKLSLPSLYPSSSASQSAAQIKQSLKEYRIKQHQLKKSNQLANRIQKRQDNRPKIFVNKSTDTTEDLKFAKLQYDRVEKENQLAQIQKDTEDNIAEITKYLKSTTEFKLNFSGVSSSIKEVSKALQKKKFDTDQMLARENVNDDVLGDPEVELKLIKNFLESEFVDVQRETAQKILDFINRVNMEKRQMPNKNSPSNAQKAKKNGKDKATIKKEQEITQLKDRVENLESKIQENLNELNLAIDEVKNLKFEVDYRDKDLTKLNIEINLAKEELNKAEVDKRFLQQQIEKSLKEKEKNELKAQEEKTKEKIQQKLKQTENRIIDVERENYVLRDEVSRIQALTKNVDEQEKNNMQTLCQMVIDSNMTTEEQRKALLKIQQLYLDHPTGSNEINKERQKYISQMMTSFKQSKIQTSEDLNATLLTSKSKGSIGNGPYQDWNENRSNNSSQRSKKQDKSKVSTMLNIQQQNDEDSILEDESQQFIKEKRIVKQKVTKTVMQKKKIIDENGEELEIEEPVQIETEEEIEIEVQVPQVKKGSKAPKYTAQISQVAQGGKSKPSSKQHIVLEKNVSISSANSGFTRRNSIKKLSQIGQSSTRIKMQDTLSSNLGDEEITSSTNLNTNINKKKEETIAKKGTTIHSKNDGKINHQKTQGRGSKILFDGNQYYQEVDQEVEVQDGWEEVEEKVVDEKGNEKIVKKQVAKMVTKTVKIKKKVSDVGDVELVEQEQEIEEAIIDSETGETKIVKKTVIQKVAIPKGQASQKYDFIEKETYEDEIVTDSITGEQKTVQKKVMKKIAVPKVKSQNSSEQENEIFEEEIEIQVKDPISGETKIVKQKIITKTPKQQAGNISFESNNNSNILGQSNLNRLNSKNQNSKTKNKQKEVVFAIEGESDEFEEEQIVDENGNIQVIQKKIKKSNNSPQEENNENNSNRSANPMQTPEGTEVQATQTDQFLIWPIVQVLLYELNVDPAKIEELQKKYFDQNNLNPMPSIIELASQLDEQKQQFEQRQEQLKQEQQQKAKQIQEQGKSVGINEQQNQYFQRNLSTKNTDQFDDHTRSDQDLMLFFDFEPKRTGPNGQIINDGDDFEETKLEVLDDKHLLAEITIKKIFLQLQKRDNKGALYIKELVRRFYNKPKNTPISFDEFKTYYIKILTIHQRCGDQCPHLMRFFSKIGYTTNKYGLRREIKPFKQKLNPFNESSQQQTQQSGQQKQKLFSSSVKSPLLTSGQFGEPLPEQKILSLKLSKMRHPFLMLGSTKEVQFEKCIEPFKNLKTFINLKSQIQYLGPTGAASRAINESKQRELTKIQNTEASQNRGTHIASSDEQQLQNKSENDNLLNESNNIFPIKMFREQLKIAKMKLEEGSTQEERSNKSQDGSQQKFNFEKEGNQNQSTIVKPQSKQEFSLDPKEDYQNYKKDTDLLIKQAKNKSNSILQHSYQVEPFLSPKKRLSQIQADQISILPSSIMGRYSMTFRKEQNRFKQLNTSQRYQEESKTHKRNYSETIQSEAIKTNLSTLSSNQDLFIPLENSSHTGLASNLKSLSTLNQSQNNNDKYFNQITKRKAASIYTTRQLQSHVFLSEIIHSNQDTPLEILPNKQRRPQYENSFSSGTRETKQKNNLSQEGISHLPSVNNTLNSQSFNYQKDNSFESDHKSRKKHLLKNSHCSISMCLPTEANSDANTQYQKQDLRIAQESLQQSKVAMKNLIEKIYEAESPILKKTKFRSHKKIPSISGDFSSKLPKFSLVN